MLKYKLRDIKRVWKKREISNIKKVRLFESFVID